MGLRVIACSLVVVSGCSLFVSLDGLTESDGGAAVSDASIDSPVLPDAATTSDGAAMDSGTEAGPPCLGFCDDFDDRTMLLGAWDEVGTTGTVDVSNATISTDFFLSAPHSAHFHAPAFASGTFTSLRVDRVLPLMSAKITLDVDIKILGLGTGDSGFASLIELNMPNYVGSISINGDGQIYMDYWVNFEDGGHLQPIFSVGAADSGWHHAHYEVVYDETNGSVLATWDGTTVGSVNNVVTFGTPPLPTTYSVSLGVTSYPSLPDLDLYFDNFRIQ